MDDLEWWEECAPLDNGLSVMSVMRVVRVSHLQTNERMIYRGEEEKVVGEYRKITVSQ